MFNTTTASALHTSMTSNEVKIIDFYQDGNEGLETSFYWNGRSSDDDYQPEDAEQITQQLSQLLSTLDLVKEDLSGSIHRNGHGLDFVNLRVNDQDYTSLCNGVI